MQRYDKTFNPQVDSFLLIGRQFGQETFEDTFVFVLGAPISEETVQQINQFILDKTVADLDFISGELFRREPVDIVSVGDNGMFPECKSVFPDWAAFLKTIHRHFPGFDGTVSQ